MESPNSDRADALSLRIGDITFALSSDEPGVQLAAQGPSRLFVAEGGQPDVRLRVVREASCPAVAGEKLFDAGSVWQLYRVDGQYQFRFTAPRFGPEPYKTASLYSDFTIGEVCLRAACFRSKRPVYALEYPLDELLMVHLLAHGRGVEVHGCGVADSTARATSSWASPAPAKRPWRGCGGRNNRSLTVAVPKVTGKSPECPRILLPPTSSATTASFSASWKAGFGCTAPPGMARLAWPVHAALRWTEFSFWAGEKNELAPLARPPPWRASCRAVSRRFTARREWSSHCRSCSR